ncbi:hypothetical protein [Mesorhizobium sp. LNJC395A00]|uniref:hypothetical protein n=1 Tax=Mesorhizobium sp. LNJC395A00 TaxID=1287275 RepID=UPI0003FF4416|nr:hypothetical protein [Mesorhizobium sp. LNJC395A00]
MIVQPAHQPSSDRSGRGEEDRNAGSGENQVMFILAGRTAQASKMRSASMHNAAVYL